MFICHNLDRAWSTFVLFCQDEMMCLSCYSTTHPSLERLLETGEGIATGTSLWGPTLGFVNLLEPDGSYKFRYAVTNFWCYYQRANMDIWELSGWPLLAYTENRSKFKVWFKIQSLVKDFSYLGWIHPQGLQLLWFLLVIMVICQLKVS